VLFEGDGGYGEKEMVRKCRVPYPIMGSSAYSLPL
jgi:hypothetical protein